MLLRWPKLHLSRKIVVTQAILITNIVKRYQKNKLFNKLGFIHIQQQATLPLGYEQVFLE